MKTERVLILVLTLVMLTCLTGYSSGGNNDPSGAPSDTSPSPRKLIVGHWEYANAHGERLVFIFKEDGTCIDYAPDYSDPYYGSYKNCTYSIKSDNSLVLDYIDDDGEDAREIYRWRERGSWMEWYVTGDKLRFANNEYSRK
ncbi:MAG: hypothetical protein FWG57_08040 [Endomicrobia bacterium]|nr:hypothetical protein [Endomicrobiia bacterium]